MDAADFALLVRSARSCRRFDESRPIPPATLRRLAELARFVPSSRNKQALRLLIVSSPEKRAAVFPHTKWAAALKWDGPALGERAMAYLFILKNSEPQTGHDSGILAQTIKLAAAVEGFASVFLGALDRPALKALLQIPDPWEIDIAIALGVPGEQVVVETLAEGQGLDYWRDAEGIHHVPKRPLEDLLIKTPCSD